MGMNTLRVNGVDLTNTYGVYVDGSLSFNKPNKRVDTISVPGRSGDLVIDYGTFENLVITYPCMIRGNFDTAFNNLVNELAAMRGYVRILCSNDTQHFREGVPIIPQTPTVKKINKDGYFDLSFNCKPFRMLVSGDQKINDPSPASVINPTKFDAYPRITFKGYGNIEFTDNNGTSYDITVAQNPNQDITIDCDLMTIASTWITNPQQYVTITGSKYPKISPSGTTIVYSNTFSTMDIYPRWREL